EKVAHMAAYSLLNPLPAHYPFEFYDHGNVGPMIPPMLQKLRELNEEWFGPGVDRLQKYLVDEPFLKYIVVGHYKDAGLPGVLVHGDLWSNNILWDEQKNLKAFIDWQLMHEGSMTFDLSRILVVCTDAELRRACTEKVFRFFYDTLGKLLEPHGKKLEFTFETVMKEARVTMFSQMGDLLSMVPFCCSHLEKDDGRLQTGLNRAKAALDDIGGYIENIERRYEFVQ
uniref:CHK domain-containing protein n=1 Tax=Steinernema glaseri TaxID=37863 RepID=A0A1I7YI32_9BILA